MLNADTIVAQITHSGLGGIGVVRLSGAESLSIAKKLFRPAVQNESKKKPDPRRPTLGNLVDAATNHVIDQCLMTCFIAPHSYTGEDVVEFSCHGSMPVLRRLTQLCVEAGARPAGRGEFTLRAVLNDKMDLTQAEAVNRLIRAKTLLQAEQAVLQLDGRISKEAGTIENSLLDTIARMEAAIDFAEEDEEFIVQEEIEAVIKTLSLKVETIVENFGAANLLREGAVVVLAGKTNVGKSTLFNTILEKDRAIVDKKPGTTRDYISETIDLEGLPLTLIDTAGLRKGGEQVEIEGMRHATAQVGQADLVLLVTVAGDKLDDEESELMKRMNTESLPYLLVANKMDCISTETREREQFERRISISALQGRGIGELLRAIVHEIGFDEIASDKNYITELRQQQLFSRISTHFHTTLSLIKDGAYDEVVLEELNAAREALNELTGQAGKEKIYERIFSQFCIGK